MERLEAARLVLVLNTTTSVFIFPSRLLNKPVLVDAYIRPVTTAFGIRRVLLSFYVIYVRRISERIPYTAVLIRSSCTKYTLPGTWCYFFPHIDQRANDVFESPPPSLVHAVTHHVSLKAYEALILSKQWSM